MHVNLHLTEGFLSNLKMTFSFLSFPKKHIYVFHHNLRKYVRITLLQFFFQTLKTITNFSLWD